MKTDLNPQSFLVLAKDRAREVVGRVPFVDMLEAAVGGLASAGIDRADLSLLAGRDETFAKTRHYYFDPMQQAEKPFAPRQSVKLREDLDQLTYGAWALGGLFGAIAVTIAWLALNGALGWFFFTAALIVVAALTAISRVTLYCREARRDLRFNLALGGLALFARVRSDSAEAKALQAMRQAGLTELRVQEFEQIKTNRDLPLADVKPDILIGGPALGDVPAWMVARAIEERRDGQTIH